MTFLQAIEALEIEVDRVDVEHEDLVEEEEAGVQPDDADEDREEVAEGDIEVEEEESEFEDEDEEEEEPAADDILRSASGVRYSREPIPPALRRRNILRRRPRTLSNPTSPLQAFKLFHSDEILSIILRETNRKVQHLNRELNLRLRNFTRNELLAAIAILLRAGVDRDNFTDITQLWKRDDSRPFYRATLGVCHFKQFLRCIRFDNIHTRRQRLAEDRLAAVRNVWTMFTNQLLHIVPSEDIG